MSYDVPLNQRGHHFTGNHPSTTIPVMDLDDEGRLVYVETRAFMRLYACRNCGANPDICVTNGEAIAMTECTFQPTNGKRMQ